jgi:hypothetical protein
MGLRADALLRSSSRFMAAGIYDREGETVARSKAQRYFASCIMMAGRARAFLVR